MTEIINVALNTYKDIKKNPTALCDQHLHELADKYSDGTDKSKAKALRTIIRREELNKIYRRITLQMEGPKTPIASLLISIKAYNKFQLQASKHSPFEEGIPRIDISRQGLSDTAEAILTGTFDCQHLSLAQSTFLQQCKIKCETLIEQLTNKQFKATIKITPEKTSSSPSGRHYGIYKACMDNDTIMQIMSLIAIHPFKQGYILDRWQQITQVMIKKKTEPYADKLRMIELFEGDYAAVLKSIMRQLMQHLRKQGHTNHGTFATEKGGSTHDAILTRVWAYDLARIQRRPIATLDNDSTGCYDRLIPQLLSIFLRRVGLPLNIVSTFIQQLNERER